MAALQASSVGTPLELYLQTSYSPDREWIDGELRERHLGQIDHANMQGLLYMSLTLKLGRSSRVLLEQRLKISEGRYRVPDLLVVDWAYREQVISIPPRLIVEIVSPDDSVSDYNERMEDYLRLGVPALWIVYPGKQKAWNVLPDGTWSTTNDWLNCELVRVAVGEIFAQAAE